MIRENKEFEEKVRDTELVLQMRLSTAIYRREGEDNARLHYSARLGIMCASRISRRATTIVVSHSTERVGFVLSKHDDDDSGYK